MNTAYFLVTGTYPAVPVTVLSCDLLFPNALNAIPFNITELDFRPWPLPVGMIVGSIAPAPASGSPRTIFVDPTRFHDLCTYQVFYVLAIDYDQDYKVLAINRVGLVSLPAAKSASKNAQENAESKETESKNIDLKSPELMNLEKSLHLLVRGTFHTPEARLILAAELLKIVLPASQSGVHHAPPDGNGAQTNPP